MSAPRHGWVALGVLAIAACGNDTQTGGTGTLKVTSYGEAFIEEGIPASEMADGWSVAFSKFEVRITDVSVNGLTLANPPAVDLVQPSAGQGQELGSLEVPSGSYSDARFVVRSVHVVGNAQKHDTKKDFDWTFSAPISYQACETTNEVPRNGVGVFEITIHADHLFYDSLVSEDPALGFDALAAADTNGDGVVHQEELTAADVGGFDTGNEDIANLWEWLSALVATLGHVDGEGHCHAEAAM